jgi:hypothetical protein
MELDELRTRLARLGVDISVPDATVVPPVRAETTHNLCARQARQACGRSHRPREDRLTHPADTSTINIASANLSGSFQNPNPNPSG